MFSFFDNVIMTLHPFIDSVKNFMWFNLKRKKHLDNFFRTFVGVYSYFCHIASSFPEFKIAMDNLIGKFVCHRFKERDNTTLDGIELTLHIIFSSQSFLLLSSNFSFFDHFVNLKSHSGCKCHSESLS